MMLGLSGRVVRTGGSTPSVGNTYYISPTGSDGNNGLSPSTPWQTISKINSFTNFQPGDSILFQSGKVFSTTTGVILNSTTCPQGGGTSSNPITVGSYGAGKATIQSTANGATVTNLSYISIKNLILVGSSTGVYGTNRGVSFQNTGSSTQYANNIDNCEISYFNNHGIIWEGNPTNLKGFYDSSITNCIVTRCVFRGITSLITFEGISNASELNGIRVHQNLYIVNCHVYYCQGDSSYTGNGTGDGIALSYCTNSLVEYCLIHNCGGGGATPGGTAGILLVYATNTITQYCEVYNQQWNLNKVDGVGLDMDVDTQGCIIQYCYAHDCQGSGLLLFDSGEGNVARFNTLINNGSASGVDGYPMRIQLAQGNQKVYNNTCYGFAGIQLTNNSSSKTITLANNIIVVPSGGTLVSQDSGSVASFKNNRFWELNNTFKVSIASTIYNSISAWQTATSGTGYGSFGDPKLSTSFTDPTTAPTYTPFGIANRLMTQFAPTNKTSNLLVGGADITGEDMGGVDFHGNTFTQPFPSSLSVGAIAVTLIPNLTLNGATSGAPGTDYTYTLSAINPTGSLTATPSATGGGIITPSTLTLNSGNSYSDTFTVNWASDGSYSVGASATGYASPTAIGITISSTDPVSAWVNAVVAAGGSVASGTQTAVTDYYNTCVSAGIWSIISQGQIMLYATDDFNGLDKPFVTPAGTTPVFHGFNSGDYSLSTGLTPGGSNSTKYIDSGLALSNYASAATALQFSLYVRSSNANGSNYQYGIGVDLGVSSRALLISKGTTGDGNQYFQAYNCNNYAVAFGTLTALQTGTRTSTTAINFYNRGSAVGSTSAATFDNNAPASNVFIGAANSGSGATAFVTNPFCYSLILPGAALNSTQEAAHNTAVQALQTALGRQV